MNIINTFSTKDYKHNTKGDYLTCMIDLFQVADVAAENLRTTGKLARNQRKLSPAHKKKIVKSLMEENRLYLWTIVVGVSSKLVKRTKRGTKIMWPTTAEEIAKYAKYIELGEGQHRSLALLTEGMREILGEFPVNMIVLVDPTEEEMLQRFCEINARGKIMSKDLLFEFDSRLNALNDSQARMDKILKAVNDDQSIPLKFKAGEGSGLSIQTVAARTVNESCDIIKAMNDNNIRGFQKQYRVVSSYLRVILKRVGSKRLNATRLGIALATLAPAIEYLRESKKHCVESNFEIVYDKWLKDILHSDTLMDCDNSTYVYELEGGGTITVKDRWNSAGTVDAAIAKDHDLLIMACKNEIVRN